MGIYQCDGMGTKHSFPGYPSTHAIIRRDDLDRNTLSKPDVNIAPEGWSFCLITPYGGNTSTYEELLQLSKENKLEFYREHAVHYDLKEKKLKRQQEEIEKKAKDEGQSEINKKDEKVSTALDKKLS